MAKMSFKCKDCGEKIVIKEQGACRCDSCGSLYKCYFEIKKKAGAKVPTDVNCVLDSSDQSAEGHTNA